MNVAFAARCAASASDGLETLTSFASAGSRSAPAPEAPDTLFRPGRLYLVRPDGFVAAEATPADAVQAFPPLMTGRGQRTISVTDTGCCVVPAVPAIRSR